MGRRQPTAAGAWPTEMRRSSGDGGGRGPGRSRPRRPGRWRTPESCPVRSAVGGAIDAALGIGFVDVAERSNIYAIGIGGIDDNFADLPRRGKSDGSPGLSRIGRLEYADPVRVLVANVGLAGTDVDDVRVGWSDGNGADGTDGNSSLGIVGNRKPGAAGVLGLPDASTHRARVKRIGLRCVSGYGIGSSAAHGANVAPLQAGEQVRWVLLGGRGKNESQTKRSGRKNAYGGHAHAPMHSGF